MRGRVVDIQVSLAKVGGARSYVHTYVHVPLRNYVHVIDILQGSRLQEKHEEEAKPCSQGCYLACTEHGFTSF